MKIHASSPHNMKSTNLLSSYLLFIALHQLSNAVKLPSFQTESVLHKQWDSISLQFRLHNGYWVRYNQYARPVAITSTLRNFTFLTPTFVFQTNVYGTPNFFPPGSPLNEVNTWTYRKSDYASPKTRSLGSYFYPKHWGMYGMRRLDTGMFIMEKWINFRNLRISFVPEYIADKFLRVTIIRERLYPSVISREEVLSPPTRPLKEMYHKLHGLWLRIHECIDNDYQHSTAYEVFRDFKVFLPSHRGRFAYEFAWRFSLSLPRSTKDRPFIVSVMWHITDHIVVTGTATYGRDGTFERDCSSVFFKLEM